MKINHHNEETLVFILLRYFIIFFFTILNFVKISIRLDNRMAYGTFSMKICLNFA